MSFNSPINLRKKEVPVNGTSFLYNQSEYVPDFVAITLFYATFSDKKFSPFGRPVLDHLAADGAGLAGSQVTVVAVGQVDTNFLRCLHLELVHGLASLRNIDLVVVGIAHRNSLLFHFLRKRHFPKKAFFVSVGVFLPAKKTIILFLKGKRRKYWKIKNRQ